MVQPDTAGQVIPGLSHLGQELWQEFSLGPGTTRVADGQSMVEKNDEIHHEMMVNMWSNV